MAEIRRCTPGQYYQGEDEQKSYTINVSNWFTSPTTASAVLFQGSTDVSASYLSISGSTGATISACTVTTPCIVSLSTGVDYRMEVMVEKSGERLECYFVVTGQ